MNQHGELQTTPSWGHRIIGMDGLRGLAAIAVLMSHVRVHLANGADFGAMNFVLGSLGEGLTLFFALSGFLLYRPFAVALMTDAPLPSLTKYFSNRVLRIFPAYLAILFIVALVLGVAYTSSIPLGQQVEGSSGTVGYLTNPLALLANASLLQTYFPSTIKTGLSVSWSLSVELAFYVAMPLLAMGAWRVRKSRKRIHLAASVMPILLILVIGAAGFTLLRLTSNPQSEAESFYLQWGGNWTAVLNRSFLVQSPLFAFGMLAAVVVTLYDRDMVSMKTVDRTRLLAIGVVLLVLVIGKLTSFNELGWALAFGGVITFVALPRRGGHDGWTARLLELLPFRYLGLISYGVYLWHIPVIWLTQSWGVGLAPTGSNYWANVIIVLTITTVLASITYFGIEKQMMRFKKRTGSTKLTDQHQSERNRHNITRTI